MTAPSVRCQKCHRSKNQHRYEVRFHLNIQMDYLGGPRVCGPTFVPPTEAKP